MGRWNPTNKQPAAHYYVCKQCDHKCFLLEALNCSACGSPFIKYDRHLHVMPNQTSLEEVGAIKLVKK